MSTCLTREFSGADLDPRAFRAAQVGALVRMARHGCGIAGYGGAVTALAGCCAAEGAGVLAISHDTRYSSIGPIAPSTSL
jgi:hypothetical protein